MLSLRPLPRTESGQRLLLRFLPRARSDYRDALRWAHHIESGVQDFRRPLTLSLSPSDWERVAFGPDQGNRCITSAWWSCRVAPPSGSAESRRIDDRQLPIADGASEIAARRV